MNAADLRPRFQVFVVGFHGGVIPLQRPLLVSLAKQGLGQVEIDFGAARPAHECRAKRFDGARRVVLVEQPAAFLEPLIGRPVSMHIGNHRAGRAQGQRLVAGQGRGDEVETAAARGRLQQPSACRTFNQSGILRPTD